MSAFEVTGTPSAATASTTAFTPTGGIAATNVQAALQELDSELTAARSRYAQVKVIADTATLVTGDGQTSLLISDDLNGLNLIDADAAVVGTSSSGLPTVQLRRVRAGSPVDMLSTRITIDVGELDSYTAAAQPVIDAANDDVATGDRIFVDVDVAGTGVEGLDVVLTFGA